MSGAGTAAEVLGRSQGVFEKGAEKKKRASHQDGEVVIGRTGRIWEEKWLLKYPNNWMEQPKKNIT